MEKRQIGTFFFLKNSLPVQDDPEGQLRVHIGDHIFVQ